MRNNENINEYLLNPKTIERLRYVYFNKLKQHREFDDFCQDYAIHILEGLGKHQTLDQFGIDWLREKTFWNRSKKSAPRFYSLHERYTDMADEKSYLSPAYVELVKEIADKHTGRARVLIFLHWIYGLNPEEVALVLNVSASRISQLLKAIRMGKKIGDFIPDESEAFDSEQTEIAKLKLKNKILSAKLKKKFRESVDGERS